MEVSTFQRSATLHDLSLGVRFENLTTERFLWARNRSVCYLQSLSFSISL